MSPSTAPSSRTARRSARTRSRAATSRSATPRSTARARRSPARTSSSRRRKPASLGGCLARLGGRLGAPPLVARGDHLDRLLHVVRQEELLLVVRRDHPARERLRVQPVEESAPVIRADED